MIMLQNYGQTMGSSFVKREKVEQHPKENLKIQTTDGNWLNYSDFALFLSKNPKETFFMFSVDKERINSLQNILKIALEKYEKLEQARLLETRKEEKIRIESHLTELEKDIKKYKKEFSQLKRKNSSKNMVKKIHSTKKSIFLMCGVMKKKEKLEKKL